MPTTAHKETERLVHVAVGVVVGADGRVLIARRHPDSHQGGLWEFPGGKVGTGESVLDALARELAEELSIAVTASEPLMRIRHCYPDKSVLLDVHRVTTFSGEPRGNEGQPLRWVSLAELSQYAFPAANRGIVQALRLPDRLLITGEDDSVDDYLTRVECALDNDFPLLQLRCPTLSRAGFERLAGNAAALCRQRGAHLVLNTSPETFTRLDLPGVGLHLNSRRLLACEVRPVPERVLLGASCHSAEEIARAAALGVDYLTLSPVAPTRSHPGAAVLGWREFARLAELSPVPVYALGGMTAESMAPAKAAGAQGIAGISFGW